MSTGDGLGRAAAPARGRPGASAPRPINAVVTTLRIIEQLAEADGPLGVSELASALGSPKPRVFRHLRTLCDRSYVVQDPETGKYVLSLRLYFLSQRIPEKTSFPGEARHVLPQLRDQLRQTVSVGLVEDQGVRVVEILRHRSAIQITTPPGTLFALHDSAQGKIALAFGPESLWKHVQDASGLGRAARKRLREEVATARVRGWAVAPEAVLGGINALAAPVLDAAGALAGTIAIVGSVQYVPAVPTEAMIAAVTGAARSISYRLGYDDRTGTT